jgi:hypothetical protein
MEYIHVYRKHIYTKTYTDKHKVHERERERAQNQRQGVAGRGKQYESHRINKSMIKPAAGRDKQYPLPSEQVYFIY